MQSLAQIPFFKDVSDIDLSPYDRRCSWKKFDDGEVIVDYEESSSDVYFIIAGELRILIRTAAGKEIILADAKSGQFIGELSAIDGEKRSANVTALTRVELCIMTAAAFREILFSSPIACDKVLRLLSRRVRDLDARLAEHTILDLKHRLYSELLRMSVSRTGHPGERIVSPPPFHHVLASRIGCRREQVTREISALTGDGLLDKTRGGLVILKPHLLEERIALALREGD